MSQLNEDSIRKTLEQVTSLKGNIILLGGPNRGQSEFCYSLINTLIEKQEQPIVIDADLSLPQISPPCCAGYGIADCMLQSLTQINQISSVFVGASKPDTVALQYLSGVGSLLQQVPTKRWIMFTGDSSLNTTALHILSGLIQLSRPSHIIAFQRNSELEPLISIYDKTSTVLHRVVSVSEPSTKSQQYSNTRRAIYFASHFQNSTLHTLSLKDNPISGIWLGRGTPLPSHLLKYIRQCFSPSIHVYYGETWGSNLGLLLSDQPDSLSPAVTLALNEVTAKSCVTIVSKQLKNLLVGVQSDKHRFMEMGILKMLDLKRGSYSILTPVQTSLAINHVVAGRIRISEDGQEQPATY